MAAIAVLLLSVNFASAQPVCDFVKVAEAYVAKHYPRSDVSKLQRVVSDLGDRWRVTWELPADTIGGTPDMEIDKRTCQVVSHRNVAMKSVPLRGDVRKFRMPPSKYPEPDQPNRIVHGFYYLERSRGGWEFRYNYLDYFWNIDGVELRARHYLDHPGPGKVAVMVPFVEFDQSKYAGVLRYLQRRYLVIETFEKSGGYVVRWIGAGLSYQPE